MDPIIESYFADREGQMIDLISAAELKNDATLFLLIGTHYLEKGAIDNVTIGFLKRSLAIKPMAPTAYNTAYIYETRLRSNSSFNPSEDEKSMIELYLQSFSMGDVKAANQLGCYFINDHNKTFGLHSDTGTKKFTPETLLIAAANKGVFEAINNLIRFYQNDSLKRVLMRSRKFEITKDITHLVEALLDMLNSGLYKQYLGLIRQASLSAPDIKRFLKSPPGSSHGTCPVCFINGSLLVFQCKHDLCFECLEKIINIATTNNLKCPLCWKELLI